YNETHVVAAFAFVVRGSEVAPGRERLFSFPGGGVEVGVGGTGAAEKCHRRGTWIGLDRSPAWRVRERAGGAASDVPARRRGSGVQPGKRAGRRAVAGVETRAD